MAFFSHKIKIKMNEYSFSYLEYYHWGVEMASRKKEKYDLIMEASLKVIAENGYHGSQISKIAKEAGVADGTIYLYFKNKEDILISLFRERLGYLIDKIKISIQDTDTADEALRKICTIHYTEFAQNVNLAYVTQIELRQSSLELRKEIGVAVKPYFQLIENIVQKGIDEQTFRPDLDTKLIRHLLFGAMDEVVTSWLISGMKFSLTAQINKTVEFFLKGLK
jgi:TetR/AcrR family fatty acid metabolism transcriptional regulator